MTISKLTNPPSQKGVIDKVNEIIDNISSGGGGVAWDDVTGKPSTFTPSAHNQSSDTINAMTGYAKATTVSAIGTSDTLNVAIGKLEKALDGKQATGDYLLKSGGTMTGAITFANNTWNNVGNDAAIGDCNVGGHIGVKQLNGFSCGFQFYNNSGTALSQLNANSGNITSSGSLGVSNNAAKMQYNSTTEAIEFVFA